MVCVRYPGALQSQQTQTQIGDNPLTLSVNISLEQNISID